LTSSSWTRARCHAGRSALLCLSRLATTTDMVSSSRALKTALMASAALLACERDDGPNPSGSASAVASAQAAANSVSAPSTKPPPEPQCQKDQDCPAGHFCRIGATGDVECWLFAKEKEACREQEPRPFVRCGSGLTCVTAPSGSDASSLSVCALKATVAELVKNNKEYAARLVVISRAYVFPEGVCRGRSGMCNTSTLASDMPQPPKAIELLPRLALSHRDSRDHYRCPHVEGQEPRCPLPSVGYYKMVGRLVKGRRFFDVEQLKPL
jgi:hypothetical protein